MGIKNKSVIKRVLVENNIKLRTKEEINQLNKQKVKECLQQRYGVDNAFQLETAKNKAKQTKLERYGDKNYHNKDKTVRTCLEKYGTTNGGWIQEAQEKIKATNLAHWGNEYYFGTEDCFKKTKATCKEKYGVEHPAQTVAFQKKLEQTMLEKYGVCRYAQSENFHFKSQHKYVYLNETFDSFPELAVYIYAIEHNIDIKRCPTKLCYTIDNVQHYYIPDFLYNNQLLEVKGDQFLTESGEWQCPFDHTQDKLFEAKHQCALKNNVIIWYGKDYKFAEDYFNCKYNKKDFESN